MKFAILPLCFLAGLAGADRPGLSPGDIAGAADYSRGRIAPGEIIVLYPSNTGPGILAGAQLDSHGKVATSLAETRVYFDGVPAPIAYSVKGQLGAVVPYEVYGKKKTEVVVEYRGVSSPPVMLAVVAAAPALFTLDSSGKGQAAMLNETGCCNSSRNPAVRGAVAVLYATGEGQTRPRGITGRVATDARVSALPVPRLPVRVLVGGKSAEILFAGEAPYAIAGLLQVNFRVPSNAPLGEAVPLVLEVGHARSPDGVTMAIRSPVQRILVIGYSDAAAKRIASILANARYEVSLARDVREGRTESPDLILCDLASSDSAALDSIRALRLERPRLKLIATAPTLTSEVLRQADLLGAETVLTHPAPAHQLLDRIRELLRTRPIPYNGEQVPRFPPAAARPVPR